MKKVLIFTLVAFIFLAIASGFFYFVKFSNPKSDNQVIDQELIQGMSRERRTIRVIIKPEIEESKIFALKQQIENHASVQTIEYRSAFENFEKLKLEHQSDVLWLETINDLKTNPSGGSFKIIVKQVSDGAVLSDFIKQIDSDSIVEIVDFLTY